MKKSLLAILAFVAFVDIQAQSIRELYQAGLKAYDEKDYQEFLTKMYAIDSIRPNYPPVVYNLAGGYALTNQSDLAIQTLSRYIQMDGTKDFSEDTDFQHVLNLAEFEAIKKNQEFLTSKIEIPQTVELPLLQTHPESITYVKKQKSFFFGGVRDGNIWKYKEGDEPIVWAESPENSWAVMGLEVSPDGKTLWACTSAMNNFEDLDENDAGKVSVLKFSLKKGTLLETFALPANHTFGDLIIDNDGNVFISDGTANHLYWISEEKGELELFYDASKTVFNMQGLTFNENQTAIYFSDYIDGFYQLTLDDKKLIKLKSPKNLVIKGVDGLYFQNNSLIGLHNGTQPNRIAKYELNSAGDTILLRVTLAQAGPLGEPTQGVIVDDSFYFIVNSPWGAYDREGNFSPEKNPFLIGILKM